MQLEQSDEEDEDEEEIPITRPRSTWKLPAKLDPKGKSITMSPKKVKKIKELQSSEVQKKKRKLL